jgi:hypothetical protein
MGALTEGTDFEIVGVNRGDCTNEIIVRTINTVDDGDTFTVDLTAYGISATGLIGVLGWEHTTDDSVSVQQNPTTAVASGTLTVTVGGSNDNNPRFFEIKGFATQNPGSSL